MAGWRKGKKKKKKEKKIDILSSECPGQPPPCDPLSLPQPTCGILLLW